MSIPMFWHTASPKRRRFRVILTPSSGQKMQKTCIFERNLGPPLSQSAILVWFGLKFHMKLSYRLVNHPCEYQPDLTTFA